MAMTECKECKQSVSKSAKTCPNCGVKSPGFKASDAAKGVLILVAVSVSIATIASLGGIELTNTISKSETTLTGKPATTFSFGGDQENHCSTIVTHDLFKSQMGKFSNLRRNQPEFEMSCNWDGKYYVISSNHDTFANINFHGKKGVPNTLFANIDAKLTTTDGDSISVSGSDIPVKL